MNVKSFLLIITISFFVIRTAAQTPTVDVFAHTDTAKLIDSYNKKIGGQSAYYNGEGYYPPPRAVKGSPFFLNDMTLRLSQIRYDGVWYKDVPVFYDLLNNQMVSSANGILYGMRSDKVTDVLLDGHHFIYVDTRKHENLDPGYYDQLYNGRSEVLVRRASRLIKRASEATVEVYYNNEDLIYIKKGNQYIQVSSKGSLLNILNDRPKQLKQYLSANKFNFRKDKENTIARLAAYYDQANN